MKARRRRLPAWRVVRFSLPMAALGLLLACAGTPNRDAAPGSEAASTTSPGKRSPYPPAKEDPSKRGNYTAGGLYAPGVQDSAPDEIPKVELIPEPVPIAEPRSRYGNRSPYTVLGKSYEVLDSAKGYVARGIASYYGKKFHGRRTSNMEVYDMYAFTAAHKTLPLPSYARVTNLDNGKSVVVRVNDRGPFHAGRIIDLSYAAAVKLDIHRSGTAQVEVRALMPGDDNAPISAQSSAATTKPSPASGMDTLVQTLPEAVIATAAGAAAPTTPSDPRYWRFDMRRDGSTMTADEFDAWMGARGVHVATGLPGQPLVQLATVADTPAATTVVTPGLVAASATASARPAVSTGGERQGDMATLQVASFASHDNAQRALSMLRDAGIGGAGLFDAVVNGRRFWRLRVGPVQVSALPPLTTRIIRLGFDPPQRVSQ